MSELNHKCSTAQKIHYVMFRVAIIKWVIHVAWVMNYVLSILFFYASTLPGEYLIVSPWSLLLKGIIFGIVSIPLTIWLVHYYFGKEMHRWD